MTNVFEVEKHATAPCRVEWTHLSAAMLMRRHYWEMGPFDLGPARSWPWLLLVRNFYVTMASAYHQARDRIGVFDGPPGAFLRSPRYGVAKLVTFYNLWEQLKTQVPNHQVFCYEQLLADPESALRRIVQAMGLPLRDDLVQAVAAEASFDNMKRLSTTADYAGTVLAPKDPSDPNKYKVRTGGGGFGQLFNDGDLAYIAGGLDRHSVRHPLEVDHVMGCFYCCRKTVWEKLGGYDESFLRGQTVDFGLRARLEGFCCIAVRAPAHAAARARHGGRQQRRRGRFTENL